MILDKQTLFTDGLAVTSTGVSAILDLGSAGAGKGAPVNLFCQVVEDFAGGVSLAVDLLTSDAADMSGATTEVSVGPVLTADLKAGYRFALGTLPSSAKRYARLAYTVDGTMTTGKLVAGIALDLQTNS